jgi:lipopolysaccharide export system protein LptA
MKIKTHLPIAVLAALSAPLALAEKADRERPIEIKAQEGTLDQINRTYELRGNAVLVQGTMRLTAERMIVKEDANGNRSALLFGSATAPVSFRQKREGFDDYMEGFADRAEFDDATDTLRLLSNARLKNGDDELRGEFIYYNSATEVLKASGAPNAARPGADDGQTREVHITLQPRGARDNAGARGANRKP